MGAFFIYYIFIFGSGRQFRQGRSGSLWCQSSLRLSPPGRACQDKPTSSHQPNNRWVNIGRVCRPTAAGWLMPWCQLGRLGRMLNNAPTRELTASPLPSFLPIQFLPFELLCFSREKSKLLSKSLLFITAQRRPPHCFQWHLFVWSVSLSYQQRQQHLQQTSHHQCFRLWSTGRFDIFWANRLQIDLFLALISFWNADESHVLSAGELFSAALCLSGWKVFHHRRRVDANLIWVRGEKPQPANIKENSADLHIHLPASWLWRLPGQPFRICRPSHSSS